MNQDMLSDNALRRAAAEVRDAMISDPALDAGQMPRCSEEFEKNMTALLQSSRRKSGTRKSALRAVAACLAVVLCLGAWLAVDVDAREATIDWIQELFDNVSWQNLSGKDYLKHPMPEYVPGWLPVEGYREVYRQWGDGICTAAYQKGDDPATRFVISYQNVSNHYTADIDEDTYAYTPNDTMPFGTTLHTPTDPSKPKILIWSMPRQGIGFTMSFYFDDDTAIAIAKSLSSATPMGGAVDHRRLSYVPEYYYIADYCTWTENEFIQTYRYSYSCGCGWEADETGNLFMEESCEHAEANDKQDNFVFSYHRIGADAAYRAPAGDQYTATTVLVNGTQATQYAAKDGTDNARKCLSWTDGEYEYCIWYFLMDTETAIAIAEGVQ